MDYTTQHIQSLFGISHQTVKNWCKEFGDVLSPTARPESNKQRIFTDSDVMVFAKAHEMLKQGKNYADVRAALAAGQRGQLPDTSLELMPAPVSGQVLALREALTVVQEENRRLQSALDEQRGRDKLLEQQLADAQAEIKALNREIGRLEARKDGE